MITSATAAAERADSAKQVSPCGQRCAPGHSPGPTDSCAHSPSRTATGRSARSPVVVSIDQLATVATRSRSSAAPNSSVRSAPAAASARAARHR